jgi:arylsulfatase A-like enzyme
VWQAIRPVYRGLVKQIDDHIGRLLACLEQGGRLEDTLIVFTADHGDHLGDHWLGEKEYFFDAAVKVPFLLYDPAAEKRGTAVTDWVECVDVVPTVLEALGIDIPDHRIEGASLLPFTRNGHPPQGWRGFAISQLDYAYREARQFLGRDVSECNAFMVREGRHKLIHWQGYAPQLFDLADDPGELHDLGADESLAPVRRRLQGALFEWLQARKGRATETYAQARDRTHAHERMMNILIGRW